MTDPQGPGPDPATPQQSTKPADAPARTAAVPGSMTKTRFRVLVGATAIVVAAGVAGGVGALLSRPAPITVVRADADQNAALPTYNTPSASPKATKTAAKAAVAKATTHTAVASTSAASDTAQSELSAQIASAEASSSPVGQHVALVKNGSDSAYAFVLSGSRTLMYAYQSSTGPGGWTNFATMPSSPSKLVSEPAAVTDQDGHVEVFARNASGQIVDGWQSGSSWKWDGAVTGTSLPGTPVGDPGAVLRKNGEAEVFTRLSDGAVAVASQKAANGTTGWSGWSTLGGALAGNPVAYLDSNGDVDLFGRSTSGTLVADIQSSGGSWSGWSTVASSPDDLTADPDPIANKNGVVEVFVTTTSGNMDSVWGNGGGSWTWGSPLTGQDLGSSLEGTPSAFAWGSDGHLEVYARLANGDLAHAWQNEPNGETDWSLWGTLPGSPSGYPTAYVNGDGAPEVLMLNSSTEVEFDFWITSSSAWSAPVVMPGAV